MARKVLLNTSLFVQQEQAICAFEGADSWVILSPIEQSIKRKIEAVGKPLKEWDIQINYGIKTGCNEAFIISTEKRDEILANCQSEEERERTAELIRPILRGRDIERYGYEWADLWIINTHNGVKGKLPRINIEDYPAVKVHLKSYWDKIHNRADQGDTPYNLRNCAYMEDFCKPKVVYMEIQTDNPAEGYPFPCFAFDGSNAMVANTAYIMSSNTHNVKYILGVINSNLGRLMTKFYVTQLGNRQFRMLAQYVCKFPIRELTSTETDFIVNIVDAMIRGDHAAEERLNRAVCTWYNLTEEEIEYVDNLSSGK